MRPVVRMLLIASMFLPLVGLAVTALVKAEQADHGTPDHSSSTPDQSSSAPDHGTPEHGIAEDRVRMMMWFRRNPNMTFEEFSDYFRLPHANLFLNTTVVKRNVMLYEQLHVNQNWKNLLADMGYPVPNYDGVMILEAATMDKALECFSNPEYNDIVLPDSMLFSDMSSAVYGPFVVASSIEKEPSPTVFNAIRNDTKRAVIAFTHKEGMSYTSFTNYFRNVNPPKINALADSTGIGEELLKYEQLTLSTSPVTVSNPFTPMKGWDAVAQVAGPTYQYLLQTSDSLPFSRLITNDANNFVDVDAGYQILPVDVVSFQIPK
ncbi:hypothetical protein PM082_004004 [Marasmius tenuissimus]|nr:hypothetical protein PM082_004004 [Marasmius tenuissimus]